jgi:parallel beta-helix repeat protein
MVINDTNTPAGSGIFIRNSREDYFRIENCTIDVDYIMTNIAGIEIQNCTRGEIRNNTIRNKFSSGIVLRSNSTNNNVTNNYIFDIPDDYEHDYGIRIFGSSNNTIQENKIYDIERYGIILHTGSNWNYVNANIISECNRMGIYVTSSSNNNTIDSNTLLRNKLGIGLYQCSYNNLTNNILNNNSYCIFEDECSNILQVNNTCSGSDYQLPIYIDALGSATENWEWAKTQSWCSGEGTETDPFIIENLKMNYFGIGNPLGIEIENSEKVHFVIRDCEIFDYAVGIMLYNTSNSQLVNNTCSGSELGIYLNEYCENNQISGNDCFDNEVGICLETECNENTLSENLVSGNDQEGIYLDTMCNNNTIEKNTVSENGYGIYIYDDCGSNLISDNEVSDNDDEGIAIDTDCNNNIVTGNRASNNSYGIYLQTESIGNNITNNALFYNLFGIYLDDDLYDIFIHRNVLDNNSIGVRITAPCYNNSIYENFFLRNIIHAQDDGTDNTWNTTTIGNYWDNWTTPDIDNDGIVDDPYTFIEGSAGSNDSLPIAEDGAPMINIIFPTRGAFSSAPPFQIEVTDIYVSEMWYTLDEGLTNYTFTEDGYVDQSAWDILPNGRVTIRFYARDVAGNISVAEVIIRKYSQTLRIVGWAIIGFVALVGAGSYYLLKLYLIKLEE